MASAKCSGRRVAARPAVRRRRSSAPSARGRRRAELTKVLVAATLRLRRRRRMSIAWSEAAASGEPAVLVSAIGQRAAGRARLRPWRRCPGSCRTARWRGRPSRRACSLRAVDRGDRRAERGDRQAGRQLDRIFQEGRGMVGRAARDGDDESAGSRSRRCRAGGGERAAGAVEQARRGLRDLGDLAAHMGGLVMHCSRLPSARPAGAVRRRNHRCRRDRSSG